MTAKLNDDFYLKIKPSFTFLTDEQCLRIHEASLEILESVGAEFNSPEAMGLLEDAGCRVVGPNRVTFPSWVVEAAVASTPKRVIMGNRKGERVMKLQFDNNYYGPGSETPFTLDVRTGQRRPAVLADVENAAKVVEALPDIDFCMSFALAGDVPKRHEDIHHMRAMLLNTVKPLLFTSWDCDGNKAIYDICCLAAGGEEAFRANPFILQYVEPITPLVNPRESLDKLMFCARNGIPMMYAPAGTLGGTTPVTFAGGFAVTNAENLMGITLMQAVRKGAHFVYGGGPGLLHPRHGTFNYGPPEGFTTRMIRRQLAKWYGFPDFNAAACSDAKRVDQQAAFEAGIGLFVTTLIGANVVHDVGYLDSGLTSSLDFLALAGEMIPLVRRALTSPEVSTEHLAMEVIKAVGIGGNYLANKHTVRHFREEIQLSDFWERGTHDAWERAGSKNSFDKINEKVRAILDGPRQVEELPAKVVEDIDRVVADLDAKRHRDNRSS